MGSLIRPLLPVFLVLFLGNSPARSDVPDPTLSSVDLVMVGNASGNPLKPAGTFGTSTVGTGFVVVVRNVTGAVMAGATVTINMSTATGNTGSANAIIPHNTQQAPTTVDCPTKTLTQVADVTGTATFRALIGGAENDASIMVRANGVALKLIKARSTDLNADGTTDSQDEILFEQNLAQNPTAPETDYNDDGITDALDRAIFQEELRSASVGTPCVDLMLPKFVSITATDVKDPKPGVTVQEEIRTLFGGRWNLDLRVDLGNISKAAIQIREGCESAGRIVYEAEFTKRDLKDAGQLSMTTPHLSPGTHCVSLFVQGSKGASATLEVRLP